MLTQIEIDGFKTFKDFKVELAPFQVIVGPNGSGKSNLFDALQLLSRLAEVDLRAAFQVSYDDPQKLRGDAHELFTAFSNGRRADKIRFAVELLLDHRVTDDFEKAVELQYTRLRYEIVIQIKAGKNGLDRLSVTYESLKPIVPEEDIWSKKFGLFAQKGWIPNFPGHHTSFIGTFNARHPRDTVIEPLTICIYADGNGPEKEYFADSIPRTILSTAIGSDYPHAFVTRKELLSWKFLHLNHEALRQPGSVNAASFITDNGSNLPTMLARMLADDEFALNDVSRDLANLVPDVVGVELRKDDFLNRYTVWVKYQDGRSFPSSVLSDGTLRLLALAALKNDEQFHGVLCFEEPENGIHPSYLKEIAHLLRSMTTNFSDPQQIDEPLRQVLVTTHSPTFISQPDAIDVVLFTYTATRVEPEATGIPPMRVTEAAPVITANIHGSQTEIDRGRDGYTMSRVKDLLVNESLDDALEFLNTSHNRLNEGSK